MRGISTVALACIVASAVVVTAPGIPALAAGPAPSATITSAQTTALIGEQANFTVGFSNAGDVGYGPYVDLTFDRGGVDGDDGISFGSANFIGSALAPLATFNCSPTLTTFTHPLTGALNVPCPTGQQIVVLQLPFGSFTPGQPVADISVNANVSNLANIGLAIDDLKISARPGFAYGGSPTGTVPLTGPTQQLSFTPQVVRFTKTYIGPEHETATGPNYPRQYKLAIDVATGQTIDHLTLDDTIPAQYAYLAVDSANANGSSVAVTTLLDHGTPVAGVPHAGPTDDHLIREFPSPIVGTSAVDDAYMIVDYFVPDNDPTSAPIIDPSTGAFVPTTNTAIATGDVHFLDPRDPALIGATLGTSTNQANPTDATMTAKSIAVQKSVAVFDSLTGDPGPTPGDTLVYTISGQVSDYFTMGGIVVDDVLGDGQSFDSSFQPWLGVTERGSTLPPVPMSGFFTAVRPVVCTNPTTDPLSGTTPVHFAISDAYAASGVSNGAGGVFTGGRVVAPGLTATGAATFTITFRTTIDDAYRCAPSQNNPLDPRDHVDNHVTTTAEVYDNATQQPQATRRFVSDDSGTQVTMNPTSLDKSIWARNGVVGPPAGSPAQFAADDTITYRIHMHIPSSDVANLNIGDYLPLPVLTATGLTKRPTQCASSNAPAVGEWCYGPADTFHNAYPVDPTVTADPTANSITWGYGTRENATNVPSDIELLFTLKISNAAFREGLFLTNQAQSFEQNSFGSPASTPGIVQIELTEPLLNIDKGVVAASTQSPLASFSGNQQPSGGVTFGGINTGCPGFGGGSITSSNTANGAPAANVSGLDANDIARFAITVENTGKGLNGAFGVTIADAVPPGFQVPASGLGGLNLCVTNGAGTPLVNTPTGFFDPASPGTSPLTTGTITLADTATTGALGPFSPTSGTNIAVITYNLQLIATIAPNTPASALTNAATITNYSASPGGANFLPITPPADLTASATVSTKPLSITKSLLGTDQPTTLDTSVAIGEQAQYSVTVTVPEGVAKNVRVVDTLPPGLTVSSTPAPSAPVLGASITTNPLVPLTPVIGGSGATLTYDLGDVTNNATDNTPGANTSITFTYWAVVDNVLSNQQGTVLTNSAAVTYTGGPSTPAVAGTPITVVEPNLRVAKSANPTSVDAGDPVRYTIVVSHNSPSAEADNVTLADQIPPGLTYVPGSLVVAAGLAPTSLSPVSAGAISAAWTSFPVGSTTTFTYTATVDTSYNPVSSFANTAKISWTGLPGSPPQERTGADGPGSGLNNYAGASTATVQPAFPKIVKTLVATSEAATTAPNATIGEILTYDLLVTIPEGSNAGFSVSDEIPAGMKFVPGSLQVFTANGGTPATTLTSPFNGTLGAETDTGGTGDGVDVTATFGPTTNNADGLTTNDSIVVRLQARVLDVAGNVGFGSGQTTLDNRGVVQLAGSTPVASNVVASPVVEPHLTMNKSISPNTAPQGASVTIDLAVKNDGQSNANEVVITDPLDANLNVATVAPVSTPPGFTYSLVGRTITYTATTAVIAPRDRS